MSHLTDQFIIEARAVGANVTAIDSQSALGAHLAAILLEAGARRVIQARHPLLAGLELSKALSAVGGRLETWGNMDHSETRNFAATADTGIDVAAAAIAATGTVALAAGPNGGRMLTLLPPRAVIIVPEATLVPDLRMAFVRILLPSAPPSACSLITGPSRSADIEGDLAVGVHGPGDVRIVLIKNDLTP